MRAGFRGPGEGSRQNARRREVRHAPVRLSDDNNNPAGFDLDIIRAVAAHIGVPVEFTKVTSVSRVPLLLSGNIDLVAASMTHTRERERTIDSA